MITEQVIRRYQKQFAVKVGLLLISLVLGVSGLYLLYSVDWKIAVGVFLSLWGYGINKSVKEF